VAEARGRVPACGARRRASIGRGAAAAALAGTLLAGTIAPAAEAGAAGRGIAPATLAIVVNLSDPLSVEIGQYYRQRRGVPRENVLHTRFEAGRVALPRGEFTRLRNEIEARTPPGVQAYALTWAQPYRVGCMSITTAFAAGFDEAFCGRKCSLSRRLAYFDSPSIRPHDDFGIRPTMMLAARDLRGAKALVDRGIAADGTHPGGTAYLVRTPDRLRNIRAADFPAVIAEQGPGFRVAYVEADALRSRSDVMFYFTGARTVAALETNRFLPGAIADHLTSSGGRLTDSRQMSSLRWLEAGATGSYGTVTEPCAILDKFPVPAVVMRHYRAGETLLEAYWKSVAMPGQGVFIGEPLARPFARADADRGNRAPAP
jgi:uncharacterized protein (TIGR03790 family)